MKWKCDIGCAYGPCICEGEYKPCKCCVCDDFPIDWKKVDDEPERKAETGLPEWLRVGSFVVFNGCNTVCRIEGYDIDKKIVAISEKSWRASRTVKRDLHCDPKGENARVVFPRPYTFETAPHIIKTRKKDNGEKDVMQLYMSKTQKKDGLWSFADGEMISFEKSLRDYEQLDGWPCGTFDEWE